MEANVWKTIDYDMDMRSARIAAPPPVAQMVKRVKQKIQVRTSDFYARKCCMYYVIIGGQTQSLPPFISLCRAYFM